jgi:hypothetical protein
MTESLVLNDGRMAHTPIFIEDAVGKYLPLPAHLQSLIREVMEIDILAAKILLGEGTAIQDELLCDRKVTDSVFVHASNLLRWHDDASR